MNTYLSKGNLEDYVSVVDKKKHIYKVHSTLNASIEEFSARITQVHAPVHIVIEEKPKEKTVSEKLLEKSVHAVLSAIEIYNKPDFKYREETFAILIVNAWETLLKAKCVKEAKEDVSSINVKDSASAKTTSRCGNVKTIDIFKAARYANVDIDLLECLNVLVEIRDNAIHFMNDSKLLNKKVLEVGTASLRSFVEMVKDWFDYDLSQYNFYLMPLSFFHPHEMESYSIHSEEEQHQNLLKFIANKETERPSDPDKKHNISLRLQTKFERSSSIAANPVKYDPDNPNAVSIRIDSEEKFAQKYRWSFADLIGALKKRFPNFKQGTDFNGIKKELEKDENLCGLRYLDFKNKTGTPRKWYYPIILKEFEKFEVLIVHQFQNTGDVT